MRRSTLQPEDFRDRKKLATFEGGAVYTAEREGRFFLIQDESTLADLLSDEDAEGIEFVKVFEFDTPAERAEYISARRWN